MARGKEQGARGKKQGLYAFTPFDSRSLGEGCLCLYASLREHIQSYKGKQSVEQQQFKSEFIAIE
jgi:hypothetical protein